MTQQTSIRVLVVDDAALYRKVMVDILKEVPGIEIVGTAANGKIALQKIGTLRPDVITLDLEMPEVDGFEVLRRLQAVSSPVGVICCSSLCEDGADSTIKALNSGAFDFVLKPTGSNFEENASLLRERLVPKIEALVQARDGRKRLAQAAATPSPPSPDRQTAKPIPAKPAVSAGPIEVVTLGISTGGPQALTKMMPQLPETLGVPILIVQHMPPAFTKSLADSLNEKCALHVREAAHGDVIEPNVAYIAPGGKQMKVIKQINKCVIKITDDPPENSCKPAVDYLFRSVADVYGGRTLAVIMTGMGNDGTAGFRVLRQHGATLMCQDEATCVVYGMPRMPVEEGIVNVIAPLGDIASQITRIVGRKAAVLTNQ